MKHSTFLVSVFFAQVKSISLFPLPIHLLSPLILYPPGTFVAVVSRDEASEPIFPSVSPHPAKASTFFNFGSHLAFYSSLPNSSSVLITKPHYTTQKVATPASTLAISAIHAPIA